MWVHVKYLLCYSGRRRMSSHDRFIHSPSASSNYQPSPVTVALSTAPPLVSLEISTALLSISLCPSLHIITTVQIQWINHFI